MSTGALRAQVRAVRNALLSEVARPWRFAATGGVAGLAQLGLLALFTHHGWQPIMANAVAFLLAAQLNFALSSLFTWHDRRPASGLPRRWLFYHASIAGMALVNMAVFTVAQTVVPPLPSSLLGIAVASIGNFLAGDRLVFGTRARGDTQALSHGAPRQAGYPLGVAPPGSPNPAVGYPAGSGFDDTDCIA